MNNAEIDVGVESSGQAVATFAASSASPASDRRHDLDALRAIAMLLGIVLHAALSFAPIPWTVQDSQQSDWYYILFAGIHGFRMPLFFLLSGYFTAMLWRKRGLASLLKHRFKRIFVPLVIGCFTIIPSMWIVSYVASRPSPGSPESSMLFSAVVAGDVDGVRRTLENSNEGIDELDANSGSSALCTAVFIGHTDVTQLLIESGADVNLPNRDLATPLHVAVFMGRANEAALLIEAGADVTAVDGNQSTPADLLKLDFGTTNFIASSLGVPVDEETLLAGRRQIAELLNVSEYLGSSGNDAQFVNFEGLNGLLFQLPVFMHLWFLWFLCWLVAAFMIYAPIVDRFHLKGVTYSLALSPVCLCWLIPLTMLPQSFMTAATFGPDSSIGLLPIPSVLAYYAVFFFFGAIYWDMGDASGQLGRWWFISLPIALLVVFPAGLDLVSGIFGIVPEILDEPRRAWGSNLLQATYAWLMAFGTIGLFRRLAYSESRWMRYISDSSYWLYLIHLPLVILAQWLVRDWQIPASVKFIAIVVVVSGFLLLTYEYCVRYTLIGRLLNGPRTRAS